MTFSKVTGKFENIQSGITWTAGRGFRFRLRLDHDPTGFDSYILENVANSERLVIPKHLFGLFRSHINAVGSNLDHSDDVIEFKGRVKYRLEIVNNYLRINAEDSKDRASGVMTIPLNLIGKFQDFIFDQRVQYGNDILGRILAYHKLFKFTFSESSSSLNSGLSLRTDVLSFLEDYVPSRSSATGSHLLGTNFSQLDSRKVIPAAKSAVDELKFKSRLGERNQDNRWSLNYEALFGTPDGNDSSTDRRPKVQNINQSSESEGRWNWRLSIAAQEFKKNRSGIVRCELTITEMNEMRSSFLKDRESQLFIGFEMVDLVFKTANGRMKSFKFPLYYMPVSLAESGRVLIIEHTDNGRFYLNYLALANAVEKFSGDAASDSSIANFFEVLLAQKIEFDGRHGRVYLARQFPVDEEIFNRVREIFFGIPGENGRGGMFSKFSILGSECHPDEVYLFKSSMDVGPLKRALELDLEAMLDLAERRPDRFNRTLPGRFLSASKSSQTKSRTPFCASPFMPNYLPRSTRMLLERLNANDLVLLEGPPGTGKTFTIMNLVIHAVCSGQRILIVSDQEAALHALNEKILEYLGGDSGTKGIANRRLWTRAVQLIDELPKNSSDLSGWARLLSERFSRSEVLEPSPIESSADDIEKKIAGIDLKIKRVRGYLQKILDSKMSPSVDVRSRIGSKRGHATTLADVEAFVEFLGFLGTSGRRGRRSDAARNMILSFVRSRDFLNHNVSTELYRMFSPMPEHRSQGRKLLVDDLALIDSIIARKPRRIDDLKKCVSASPLSVTGRFLIDYWQSHFPRDHNPIRKLIREAGRLFSHPGISFLRNLRKIFVSQIGLLEANAEFTDAIWKQLLIIHEAMAPDFVGAVPLSLEICRFAASPGFFNSRPRQSELTVQGALDNLAALDAARSELVKRLFLTKLETIVVGANTGSKNGVSPLTKIGGLLHGIRGKDVLEQSLGQWREFQEAVFDAFPLWLCRKQAVPFMFPCESNVFDLVIVDEATQCRVDDALPLMFRAKKFMVVGDDKQTVLAKNSAIDDYLFREFNLDEHLKSTQARGVKGGGSHIFGLVKGIREASVMLDEHYRCPPEIIEYSNKYVYGSELKVMQWRKFGDPAPIKIDWTERHKAESQRPESGQFKGIEIDMIDRYLDWVAREIELIERETGRRVNVETDVALVYFLLKNEPYIKSRKSEFLARLGRGSDVLDGAGAALQGKERPYIFYLWDINRGNAMAFRQGDDPDKRKGELNVLMSRPKMRAYHYLHRNFDQLDHEKSTIAEFLWRTFLRQDQGDSQRPWIERKQTPGAEFFPWRRSSGHLMLEILKHMTATEGVGLAQFSTQTGVVVGDPRFKVDLVLQKKSKSKSKSCIGIVDVCGFDWHQRSANDVIDYFFQLKRAQPQIAPIFLFIHELTDCDSKSFNSILSYIKNYQG